MMNIEKLVEAIQRILSEQENRGIKVTLKER